ncbi:hypothetical protein ACFC8N_46965 [Streptomyces sp. NPDC055966]|uniref:hypothetical protein n=1 Tax=Streptomyces sp. NPDC055966 TaxID=3345669 RepID=UPI0035D68FBD
MGYRAMNRTVAALVSPGRRHRARHLVRAVNRCIRRLGGSGQGLGELRAGDPRRSNTSSASASSARNLSASARISSARTRAAASRSSSSPITDVTVHSASPSPN